MKIELQNTLLSGQRPGRTINCHEDDGTEVLLANIEVLEVDGICTATVEHSSRQWPEGVKKSAYGSTEQEAVDKLVQAFLDGSHHTG